MSDKQHAKHLAQYWNGPVTRAEAQKVFDETAQAVLHHQQVITKLDMVVAFLVEKSTHTTEEIQAWMNEKVIAHQAAEKDKESAPQTPNRDADAPSLVSLD